MWRAQRTDGTPCVVKRNASAEERTALRLLGPGCVRVLRELPNGVVLELLEPGRPVRDVAAVDGGTATTALAEALRRLHVPDPGGTGLPRWPEYAAALDDPGATTPLPARLVDASRSGLGRRLVAAGARGAPRAGDAARRVAYRCGDKQPPHVPRAPGVTGRRGTCRAHGHGAPDGRPLRVAEVLLREL